jgi:hypothetical protein
MLMVSKSRYFTPLFEKDDCRDAGGRAMHGAIADDCRDAGGRVTQEAVTEGLGEIFQINPPQSPFFKGGGYF